VEEPVTPRHPAGPRTESTEPAVDAETQAGDTAEAPGGAPADRGAATSIPGTEDPGTEDTGETTEDPGTEDTGETTEEDGSPDAAPEPDVAQLAVALAERTADLQRLQAEYVNYKRRVDRDRELVRENATYAALAPIVDVLDTIDRAREHGELDAGFAAVADQLERVVSSAGLVKYGEPGDAFDPRLHEALSHIGEDPEVEVTTCKVIAKAGYRIGNRVVRAAQVLVVDPASG
jgi:molecular chaperone GrpE